MKLSVGHKAGGLRFFGPTMLPLSTKMALFWALCAPGLVSIFGNFVPCAGRREGVGSQAAQAGVLEAHSRRLAFQSGRSDNSMLAARS